MTPGDEAPMKTYRVVQWATGRQGKKAIRGVVAHPQLELVGLIVHSPDKEGMDAGELAGIGPTGVFATRSIDDVLALKPDCVLYMREGFDVADIARLLGAGINIVTTRSEFFYGPWMDPAIYATIEAACQAGRSSIHATGSSPGFSTTTIPLALVYPMQRVDEITIDEYADIPASTPPDMITQVMGFGSPVENLEMDPSLLEHTVIGYQQSMAALAAAIGLPLDGFEVRGDIARAADPRTLSNGAVIAKGTMAAQRITVAGMRNGKPFITFRAHWACTPKLEPDWHIEGEGWLFTTRGDAPMQVRVTYGRTDEGYSEHLAGYTATPAVNAVPCVVEAEPGIRTIFDMPPLIARFSQQ